MEKSRRANNGGSGHEGSSCGHVNNEAVPHSLTHGIKKNGRGMCFYIRGQKCITGVGQTMLAVGSPFPPCAIPPLTPLAQVSAVYGTAYIRVCRGRTGHLIGEGEKKCWHEWDEGPFGQRRPPPPYLKQFLSTLSFPFFWPPLFRQFLLRLRLSRSRSSTVVP